MPGNPLHGNNVKERTAGISSENIVCLTVFCVFCSYVTSLSRLHELFEVPMGDFVKSGDLKVVFSVSNTIKGLHEDFLKKLKERLEKPITDKGYYTLQVGDLFVQVCVACVACVFVLMLLFNSTF